MRISNINYSGDLEVKSPPRLRTNIMVFTNTGSELTTLNARGKVFNRNTTHTNTITTIYEDMDRFIYTGSTDSTVKKFNKDFEHQWNYSTVSGEVRSIFVTPNMEHVFVGSSDGQMAKLSADTGTEIWRTNPLGSGSIEGIAIGVDGSVYAITASTLMKIDTSNGEILWQMTDHTTTINSLAITIDNTTVTVDTNGIARITDTDGIVIKNENVHSASLVSVSSDVNGNIHVLGSDGLVATLNNELTITSSFTIDGTNFHALSMDHLGRHFIKVDDKVMCIDQLGQGVWVTDSMAGEALYVTRQPVMVQPVIETAEFIELEPPTNLTAS